MARPKKNDQDKRSERSEQRYTVAERVFIRDQALRAGISETEFIRRRALSLPVKAAPTSSSDPALVSELNRIGVNLNQIAKAMNAGRGMPHSLAALQSEIEAALVKVLS